MITAVTFIWHLTRDLPIFSDAVLPWMECSSLYTKNNNKERCGRTVPNGVMIISWSNGMYHAVPTPFSGRQEGSYAGKRIPYGKHPRLSIIWPSAIVSLLWLGGQFERWTVDVRQLQQLAGVNELSVAAEWSHCAFGKHRTESKLCNWKTSSTAVDDVSFWLFSWMLCGYLQVEPFGHHCQILHSNLVDMNQKNQAAAMFEFSDWFS